MWAFEWRKVTIGLCVRGRGVNRGEGYPSELCLETSSAADTIDESNDQGEQSFPLRINSATKTRTSKHFS